jgi:hypothetical protein
MKNEQRCYNQLQESKDTKAKEKLRSKTFCGRLDRTINYARDSNTPCPCANTLDGKGRRHGQHDNRLGTKTKRKECGIEH